MDQTFDPASTCVICGSPLIGEPDDQPDWATGPMCGNCYQAREMDNEIWWSAEDNAAEDEDEDENA